MKLISTLINGSIAKCKVTHHHLFVPPDNLQFLYHKSFLHYFEYCCLVSYNYSKTLKKICKLQNKAARTITTDDYDIQLKQVIETLGRKTLEERHESRSEIKNIKL